MKLSQYTFGYVATLGLALFGVMQTHATQAWAYEHNYTCERGRNECAPSEEGEAIVWDRSCVLFYLDEGGSNDFENGPDGKTGPALAQIVKTSFDAWNHPECSGINLLYGGLRDPNDQPVGARRNLVTFEQQDWAQTSQMTFATTVVNYHPQTGAIREADIMVNDQFYRYATGESPAPGEADLQNTLVHEVGHFLGMAHSDVADATMHGSAALGETKKRTLHRDDVEGLCAHYPASEYTGTCGHNGGQDSGQSSDEGFDHDGGSDSFDWGSDDDQSGANSACNVTQPDGSAKMSPMLIILGLFGGVLWRRRSRRSSDS